MQYPADWDPMLSKKPICGVLSVAMIANVNFAKATEVIKKNLMPFQKRHGGRTYHDQRVNSLKALGVQFREIFVSGKPTLRRAVLEMCRPGKTYMIMTSSHVVTVRDEEVADQYEIAHIEMHNSKRCIVRTVLEIL